MLARRLLVALAALALSGLSTACLEATVVKCRDGRLCPEGFACDDANVACVLPEQLEVCEGRADQATCSYQGMPAGACYGGVCLPAGCGNGMLDQGETCDDGNRLHDDGCSADCLSNEQCGNGVVDYTLGESCEPDKSRPDLWCRPNCVSVRCGDGEVDETAFEQCDAGERNSDARDAPCRPNCLPLRCGDGIEDSGEACDDGNRISGDGCSYDCQSKESCRNGYLDRDRGEECDDGNALSHDGCSSNCRLEQAQWSNLFPDTPRYLGDYATLSAAFDAGRNRLVMYEAPYTWEFEQAGWLLVPFAGRTPGAVGNYALAWDEARRCSVLFGGSDARQLALNETWSWDGAVWTRHLPASSPAPRTSPAMAYDPRRRRMVLFGGQASSALRDTWEWDGANWRELTVANAPPAGTHLMAYDPERGRVVLFDGNDVWSFDGSAWQRSEASSPLPENVRHVALYYDGHAAQLLLGAVTYEQDTYHVKTWKWTGSSFAAHEALAAPEDIGTFHAKLFHLPATGRTLLLSYAGQWIWDGAAWRVALVGGYLPPLEAGRLVYDPLRGTMVRFGGNRLGEVFAPIAETYLWTGESWTVSTPSPSPAPRLGPAMAFDGSSGRTLVFGGFGASFEELGDTWSWDGVAWRQETPTAAPSARTNAAAVYDSARNRVILFGGSRAEAGLSVRPLDTWSFQDGTWSQLPADEAPPGSVLHGMVFDAARDRVVLVGGHPDEDRSAWEWLVDRWQVAPSLNEPLLASPAMTYLPTRRQTLVVNGRMDATSAFDRTHFWSWPAPDAPQNQQPSWDESSTSEFLPLIDLGSLAYDALRQRAIGLARNPARAETWSFAYRAAEVDEACAHGFDIDGDELIGCKDPDCWGYCTPLCPPGASCRAEAPHCGDGECNRAIENCRFCPEDCSCPTRCGDFFCDQGETSTGCPGDCS